MGFWRKKRDENGYVIEKTNHKDTVGKTENFLTRNVKLITFLICVGIFLTFFGPLTIFTVIKYIEEMMDTRIPMTEEDLIELSELDRDLYFSDIEGFKGIKDIKTNKYVVDVEDGTEIREEEVEIYYYIDIGEDYSAIAVAEIDTGKIIYFQLSNKTNQWKADVLKDDIRAFFQGIPVPTEPASSDESVTEEPTIEKTKEQET